MQRGNLSESEEFFLLEMFFSSNTIGNAFQYHFFFLPTLAQLQTYIVLWGEDSLGSCAIYFCIRFWSNPDEFCWRERSYEYTTDM